MIFNMTGGGSGSGATLVVSCPANVTVTFSKDDKSYTKNSGNLGSATFKGLATGEWTVTIEGNEQTATKNITITADYAITMAFFAAYINITYPANSTCTVKTSGGTTVASDSNTGSSTKTWTATVNSTGTYTVTATLIGDSSKTKSVDVKITTDGQSKSITLTYALVLFDNGTYAAETGGWTDIENNTLYKAVYGPSPYEDTFGYLSTVNSINLSDYSRLYFVVSYFNEGNGLRIGVSPTKGTENDFSAFYEFPHGQSSSDETVYSIDISSVASGYIKARLVGFNHTTSEIRMTKVYAE